MTHSKKNRKWLPKKIHVCSKYFCVFPPFSFWFYCFKRTGARPSIVKKLSRESTCRTGSTGIQAGVAGSLSSGGQRPLALGVGLNLCRAVGSEQVQAAPTDLSLPSASAFLGIILPNQNDFQCYFLTEYHLSALRM